jgi:hypothetical protein
VQVLEAAPDLALAPGLGVVLALGVAQLLERDLEQGVALVAQQEVEVAVALLEWLLVFCIGCYKFELTYNDRNV